jgi:hypothetical protein
MRTIYQVLAVVTVSLGFCLAIVGYNSSTVPPAESTGHEKMTDGKMDAAADKKMGNDKMSSDKMSGDKMGADKMSSDTVHDDKMSGDKMSGGKMGGDKMDDGKKDKP